VHPGPQDVLVAQSGHVVLDVERFVLHLEEHYHRQLEPSN
jgi:hypothetical protein